MLRVEDNGIGMEKDKLVKIFDKFYQVDHSSKENMQAWTFNIQSNYQSTQQRNKCGV